MPSTRANHSAIGFLLGNNWQLATTSFISQAKFDSKSLRIYGGGNPPVWTDINDGERNMVLMIIIYYCVIHYVIVVD